MNRTPLFIILTTVFIALIGFGIIIPLLPIYAERFGANGLQIGLLMTIYSLLQFVAAPIAGKLSDRIGRKPVLIFSLLITVVSYVMFAFAPDLKWLFISRILSGIGGADIGVAQAYIADSTDHKNRAKGMGLFGAAFSVGFIVGPVITAISAPFSEVLPALIAAGMAGVTVIFAFFFLPESRKSGVEEEKKKHSKWKMSVEQKSIIFLTFLVITAMALLQSMIILYTLHLYGWGPSTNGLFITMFAVVGIFIQAGLISKLVNFMGERKLFLLGALFMGIGLLVIFNSGPLSVHTGDIPEVKLGIKSLIFTLDYKFSLILLIAGSMIYSVGSAVTYPSLSSLISKGTPSTHQGQAIGIFQSSNSVARIVAPILGGLLYDHAGMTAPFLAGAIFAMATAIISMKLLGVKKDAEL